MAYSDGMPGEKGSTGGGDDLFVKQMQVAEGNLQKAANSILIKVNQIGTCRRLSRRFRWRKLTDIPL